MMDGSFSGTGIYLLVAILAGAGVGWLMRSAFSGSHIEKLNDDWQVKLKEVVRQRKELNAETVTLRASIAAQESIVHQRDIAVAEMRTELESALEREKQVTKNILTLRAERENFKTTVLKFQNALVALKSQSAELQSEFLKSREIYTRELEKAFEKRQILETKVENSREEHKSFSNLLLASRSEHESVNNMLAAAQTRLGDFDALERKTIELEAENTQLRQDTAQVKQDNDALKRDLIEQEELKVQNKELARVLESMESSRKQYEDDANRYRERAGESEVQSDTLRIRLDEVEQNFIEMEKQQHDALKDARRSAAAEAADDMKAQLQERDDLQAINGIGKVFEQTLHELGIVSYRQIAKFDVLDIARVNSALNEFKGRLEHDDWIGQAKELLLNKYGDS